MKWGRNSVASAIDRDLQRPQLMLPFPDEKTIDMNRCCAILHVWPVIVRRLLVTKLAPGDEGMCLVGYNTMRNSPLRIDYDSLVRFLDRLRAHHAISDRRPPVTFGRHRDEDLLPFRWTDSMSTDEAANVLNIHRSKVLLRIEAGRFEAYQLVAQSPWRISRTSLARHIEGFRSRTTNARPYGASKILQGEV